VLDPADDYIAKFVREVNRGRVLMATSVMTSFSASNGPVSSLEGPAIAESATLEEALRQMTNAGARTAHIVDGQSRPIGELTMDKVVAAVVTPVSTKA
jgi:glycine betaine/proline transport system ATP-binding protein